MTKSDNESSIHIMTDQNMIHIEIKDTKDQTIEIIEMMITDPKEEEI